jgi:hypothetical protein
MTHDQEFNEISEDYVKVVFRFHSELFEKEMIETLWCRPLDPELGLYQVDNIPFYAPLIAADDLILAEKDEKEGGMLAYRHTVKESGNSTIHLVKLEDSFVMQDLVDLLVKLGCNFEGMNENYFAIDVPCDVSYSPVRTLLDEFEEKDLAGFSESCLSDLHQSQL